jgi:hypothetical protein
MTFKKLFIKETKGLNTPDISTSSSYQICLKQLPDYEVYFTDEEGAKMVTSEMLNRPLKFSELPKPLLKQIK